VRDHRILRDPQAWSPAAERTGSSYPLVRLDGDVEREYLEPIDRELAIAIAADGPRLPDSPQMRRIGPLVVAALDKAVADHPDDAVALRMKALALAFTGHEAKAIEIAESLLKSTPSHELLLDDYCTYAVDLKRFQDALGPAKRAVALNPWSADYRERLAFVSMQCQDWNGAVREAREALRLDPFLRFARMFLVQCLLHAKDTKGADKEFATLVKLHADQRAVLEPWLAEQRRRYVWSWPNRAP
jgi:tetratricopeptide (TPR) repeat protein